MAPPSQVVDGDPRWFFEGQSLEDPGLTRTSFGIPANCTASGPAICVGTGLEHYTFQVEQPLGTVVGFSAFFVLDNARLTPLVPGAFSGDLICITGGGPPGYAGPALETTIPGFPTEFRWLSGYITSDVYGFSLVPGVQDPPNDWFLRTLPGP